MEYKKKESEKEVEEQMNWEESNNCSRNHRSFKKMNNRNDSSKNDKKQLMLCRRGS